MRLLRTASAFAVVMGLCVGGADALAAPKKKGKKKKKAAPTEETAAPTEEGAATEGDAAAPAGGWTGGAPYGMAGCGLGTMVIKSQDKIPQFFAATTNGTSGSQTFGIISGTSNCKPMAAEAMANFHREQKLFVANNLNHLSKDAARGDGEMLRAFAASMGCEDTQYATFAIMSQERYDAIFQGKDPEAVWANFVREVKLNDSLGATCGKV